MKKIELNKDYLDTVFGDGRVSKWELLQENSGTIQLKLTETCEDEDDNEEYVVVISKDNIRAMNKKTIICLNLSHREIDEDNSEIIRADIEGGSSSSEEIKAFEIKIAKENL